jgi:hypothetical protein
MRRGRPRTLADLHCPCCGKQFHPKHATARFCSRKCLAVSRRLAAIPARPRYAHDGRLSDELQREVAAARAEAPSAPLYRPGTSL